MIRTFRVIRLLRLIKIEYCESEVEKHENERNSVSKEVDVNRDPLNSVLQLKQTDFRTENP